MEDLTTSQVMADILQSASTIPTRVKGVIQKLMDEANITSINFKSPVVLYTLTGGEGNEDSEAHEVSDIFTNEQGSIYFENSNQEDCLHDIAELEPHSSVELLSAIERIFSAFEDEPEVKEFNIPLCRTGYSFTTVTVHARTQEEAEELALEQAGDCSYSEKNVEYNIAY